MCIPGLHLSLEIYNRIWDLLCDACHDLDLQLAHVSGGGGTCVGDPNFSRYSNALHRRSSLKLEMQTQESYATVINQMITFALLSSPTDGDFLSGLRKEAATTQQALRDMVILKFII